MNNIIKKLLRTYNKMETFDEKVLWCVAPAVTLILLATGTINVFQKMFPFQIWVCYVCSLLPIICLYFGVKTRKFKTSYYVCIFILNVIIVPLVVLTNGGLKSGMPIISVITLASGLIIADRKVRYLAAACSVMANGGVMLLEILCPDVVGYMPANFDYSGDNLVCYLVAALTLTLVVGRLMDAYNEQAFSKKTLERFMDAKVQEIAYKQSEITNQEQIDSVCTYATVLLADVSAFSSVSQAMSPQKMADYLNLFLKTADDCIRNNDGVVDKYMGDAIMAYWIDEDQTGYGAYNACKTIIDLRKNLHILAEQIHRDFGCGIDFTAGINYGEVVIASLGSERHLEYTIVGKPINVTTSLQSSATKGECIVSQAVYNIVNKEVELEKVPNPLLLKGNAQEADVYKLKSINNHRIHETKAVVLSDTNKGYMFNFCGCRGSYAVSGAVFTEFGGETSCYVLKKEKYAMVIDCGTGLYKARSILAGCERIDVLLTHVHYDHILGLLDWSVFPKEASVHFYGNFSQWEGEKTISNFLRAPFWPIDLSNAEITSIEKEKSYCLNNEINVIFYESSHPNYGCVISLDIAGTKAFIMADLEDPDTLPKGICKRADILIFDGMYEQKDYSKHVGWGHSTWERGVRLALEEKVKLLFITHHNPANTDATLAELEKRAQDIFPNTRFAREGDKLYI